MRIPSQVVADAWAAREQGMSLLDIREMLGRRHGIRPSLSTIHGWFSRGDAAWLAE
jgi:hypothetical protein